MAFGKRLRVAYVQARKRAATITSFALVAQAGLFPAAAGNADTGLTQPLLVAGTAGPNSDEDGIATVYLYPESRTANAVVGTTFTLPVVAQAVVTAGRFEVPVPSDLTAVLGEAAQNGGHANFLLSVVTAKSSGSWSFTRAIESAETPVITVPLDSSTSAMQGEYCLQRIKPGADGAMSTAGEDDTCVSSDDPPTPPSGSAPCYADLIGSANYADTIGEVHVPIGGTASYEYAAGASSDIAVGVSIDGSNWKTEGSTKMSKTQTASTRWENLPGGFANQLQTFFHFQKFRVWGYCPQQYMIKGNTWMGGTQTGVGVGQWDGQCLTKYPLYTFPFQKNTRFKKVAAKGFTYQIGATAFGVHLHSTSDWSASHTFETFFTQDTILCGNDGGPPTSTLVYR